MGASGVLPEGPHTALLPLRCAVAVRVQGRQPTLPEEIDPHVTAEFPDISACAQDPSLCDCDAHRLHRLVGRCMIHEHRDRCYEKKGSTERQAWCKYAYPFPVTPVTYIDDRGRVRYRRRSEDDENVVSYNPALSLKLDAHVNVDIAHTTM